MQERKLDHVIRHIEHIAPGVWEVSTRTEDGHRLGGTGRTVKQAIWYAAQSAKIYGEYKYPH